MADNSYSDVVKIDTADRFKRMAQEVAARSNGDIGRFGFKFVEWTRGESVQLYEHEHFYLAHVNEGLGTLNMVHDKMWGHTLSRSYDRSAAYNTVASIVNDSLTLGAMPISVSAHIAAGSEHWFYWEERVREFLEGWLEACTDARCRYDGGETPILRDLVKSDSAVLSGSAIGIIKPKSRLIRRNIQAGDSIIMLGSSGIHANGVTLARKIAEKLPDGYLTKMADGRMFGEALCDKAHIYV
ncbi:MAG: AIR synthase related protein, partial [bacterium]|nr:AIR synthase related protein [bacterium]